jgi:hypothetical protein
MALADATVLEIREHIGNDKDFSDDDGDFDESKQQGSLEALYTKYTDVERVALHVWRNRLANHQNRAFDFAQEGNWMARSQKSRFLKSMVKKYEMRTREGARGSNAKIQSQAEAQTDILTE